MARHTHWLRGLLPLAILLCACLGCTPAADTSENKSPAPQAGVELRLLVVDDVEMAAEIDLLRADWRARTGVAFSLVQMTTAELNAATELDAGIDAVIYPSGELGLLAQRRQIVPLPADYAANRELDWSDTFELLQVAETQWGKATYAVPFGSPVLTLYCRADLLEAAHKRVPQTWSEYHELAEFFSHRENLGAAAPPADAPWHGAVEPLAEGWAGRVLLARAAAYAKHRDHYSALFKIDTMQPLIGSPAFVRALEELVADSKLGPADAATLNPAAARGEFLAGHAALALSWPSGAKPSQRIDTLPATQFAELPGSTKVYNFAGNAWDARNPQEETRVPLLCLAGRLGSITATAAHPAQAFQLLAWLAGDEWGRKVSSASRATTLYRPSQVAAPDAWLDPHTPADAARHYARAVQDALSHPAYLFALRIPGQEKYFAALDHAVHQAVSGQQSPQAALEAAAAEWETITTQLDRDAQRRAYRHSLGLDP